MSLRTTGLGKMIPEGGGHPPGLGLRAGPSWSELPQLPHRSNPVTTTSEMCGFSSFLWCSPGTAPHLRQASHLNILFRESPRRSRQLVRPQWSQGAPGWLSVGTHIPGARLALPCSPSFGHLHPLLLCREDTMSPGKGIWWRDSSS